MQTTVAELERQLAASRAQVKTAEKDREEVSGFLIAVAKRAYLPYSKALAPS